MKIKKPAIIGTLALLLAIGAFSLTGTQQQQSSEASGSNVAESDVSGPSGTPDGIIDVFDLSYLLFRWGNTGSSGELADINQDNVVNIFDLSIMLSNWGLTVPALGSAVLPDSCDGNTIITATPGNITNQLTSLSAGETLLLAPGLYSVSSGTIINQQGTKEDPICVIAQNQPIRQEIVSTGPEIEAARRDVINNGRGNNVLGNSTIKAGSVITFESAQWWRIEGLDFNSRTLRFDGGSSPHDFHIDVVNTFHTSFGLIVDNGNHLAFRDSVHSYIRSGQQGVDRHALTFLGNSGDITYTGNACENPSADCVQSQGNGDVYNVFVHDSIMRINRPHPGSDPFCNTGENAFDIKVGRDWTISESYMHGWQEIQGCSNFESTSAAGEAIVIHKKGAQRFDVVDNVFANNTEHMLIAGKTCTQGGTNCSGPTATDAVTVRGNTMDNSSLPGNAVNSTAIRVVPSVAANNPEIGDLQFSTPRDTVIEDNIFTGNNNNIGLFVQTTFQEPPPGTGRPTGTVIRNNNFSGEGPKITVGNGIECTGNDCP